MVSSRRFVRLVWKSLLLVVAVAAPAWADNEGLEDLDEATKTKIVAENIDDLNEAIDLVDLALEMGLDDENTDFAEHLLVCSLLERATLLSSVVLRQPVQGQRVNQQWMQFRQFALSDLQRSIDIDDEIWEAYLLIGRLQSLPLGDPNAARRALTKVVNAPELPDAQRSEAFRLRAIVQRDDEARMSDLSQAIDLDPNNPEFLRIRSQIYLTQEKLEEALADIDRALALEPEHAGSHEVRGMILLGMERYEDAMASFDRTTELAPEAALPYQHRSQVYRQQGDLEKAIQQLSRAIDLSPDNVGALMARGMMYLEVSEVDLALKDIDEVIRIRPQLLQPHMLKAEIYAGTDRISEAIEQLEAIVQLAPEQAALLDRLATFYLMNGQTEKAIEFYTRLLDVQPEDAQALRDRGSAYLGIGEHENALADFEQSFQYNDSDPGLLNNFAWVLATSPNDEVRDGARAVEMAKIAAETTGYQVSHILSTLAAGYAETGDFDNAIHWSEQAVELSEGEDTSDQLANELAKYQEGKPWRELQLEGDQPPLSETTPAVDEEPFIPQAVVPAPARTVDF